MLIEMLTHVWFADCYVLNTLEWIALIIVKIGASHTPECFRGTSNVLFDTWGELSIAISGWRNTDQNIGEDSPVVIVLYHAHNIFNIFNIFMGSKNPIHIKLVLESKITACLW